MLDVLLASWKSVRGFAIAFNGARYLPSMLWFIYSFAFCIYKPVKIHHNIQLILKKKKKSVLTL